MTALSDTPRRYGHVTRALHWAMAAIFALQLLSAAAHWAFDRKNPIRQALWAVHQPLGILLLIAVRVVWALTQAAHRPPHPGAAGLAARLGHVSLYILMVAVPTIAVLRAWGSGRGLEILGVPLLPATGTEITFLSKTLGGYHGLLGWTLAALIVGHIAAALIHTALLKDGTLRRMAGAASP